MANSKSIAVVTMLTTNRAVNNKLPVSVVAASNPGRTTQKFAAKILRVMLYGSCDCFHGFTIPIGFYLLSGTIQFWLGLDGFWGT